MKNKKKNPYHQNVIRVLDLFPGAGGLPSALFITTNNLITIYLELFNL